jgi:gamma-glutamylcyclotransferase (GGCT)/AIG2-like uncharacterized protein YtfP
VNPLIFVYGTLKRRSRHPMARRLAQTARWVGAARLAGRLYDLGRFPGLKPPRNESDWVQGDVYDLGASVSELMAELDVYENAESPPPTPYERTETSAILDAGGECTVWAYWYQGAVTERQFIESGSYEANCDPE